MQKNDIVSVGELYYRILTVRENTVLAIDCNKETMPVWISNTQEYSSITLEELIAVTRKILRPIDMLSADSKKIMYQRYGLISPLVSSIENKKQYSKLLAEISLREHISKQTLRNFLCSYLVYQDLSVLAPAEKRKTEKELSDAEKDFRWALNRWYYNQNQNTLQWTYNQMLREKYCDAKGKLLPERPTYNQFYYYFQKTQNRQNVLIARNGLGDYKRNDRPLLGDNLQARFPGIGCGMIDGTVCDIYLVDASGNIIGRPVMTACIDANSALCCGFFLSWEGGTYSLRNLMLNVIADKVEYCRKHNIIIRKEDWDCSALPGMLISDKGSEYIGETFSQLTDLGVILVDLEAFRPDLKPMVEKFFDIIQGYFRGELRGKGVVDKDFGERTNRIDYRKHACLTLEQFEEIIIRAVIYYNSQRTLEFYPYSEDMLDVGIQPTSAGVWNYKKKELGANLIPVSEKGIVLTLLPRTNGRFERNGLIANKLRYVHLEGNFTERYLSGADVILNHTMFPLNARFVSSERRKKAFISLETGTTEYQNLLYRPRGKSGVTRYLRYCPFCAQEDRKFYGEAYWHREHQMPGLIVCQKHGCYLTDTDISINCKTSPSLYACDVVIPTTLDSRRCTDELELKVGAYYQKVCMSSIEMDVPGLQT